MFLNKRINKYVNLSTDDMDNANLSYRSANMYLINVLTSQADIKFAIVVSC